MWIWSWKLLRSVWSFLELIKYESMNLKTIILLFATLNCMKYKTSITLVSHIFLPLWPSSKINQLANNSYTLNLTAHKNNTNGTVLFIATIWFVKWKGKINFFCISFPRKKMKNRLIKGESIKLKKETISNHMISIRKK